MIIVLTLLALLVGLSWPAVQRLAHRSRVTDAAKTVRTELAEARLRAIESGTPQVFRFEWGTNRFEIRPKAEENDGPAVLKSALEEMADDAVETEALTGAAITDPASYEKYLPEGMYFAGQEVAEEPGSADAEADEFALSIETLDEPAGIEEMPDDSGWSTPVIFYPNGRTSNANIRLTDRERYLVDVSLRGLTGAVRIGPMRKIEEVAVEETLEADDIFVAEGHLGPLPVEAQP